MTNSATRKTDVVKYVWDLMVKDFYWSREALSQLRVAVRGPAGTPLPEEIKLQPFEVVVAAVFAHLRPDYDWWVTPNRADRGIDFVGQGVFLRSKELGIDAAITIGGQCKKRGARSDVVGELAGSFVKMARELHPTFFVAAFAAPLTPKLIAVAKADLESTLQRHCHIIDRPQLESLIGANLPAARPIIQEAFRSEDASYLLEYFKERAHANDSFRIHVTAPTSVLAGEPFRVRLQITRSSITEKSFRLEWKPGAPWQSGILVTPLGADAPEGIVIEFLRSGDEDPFISIQDLEFVVYAIGKQSIGTVAVHNATALPGEPVIVELPSIEVVENLRPPFYDPPYRVPLDELERGLNRARAGRVSCVGIVGAGGAGKTRLCEEFCLEARRRGAYVVSARQAHSTESPRRILANLILGLTETGLPNQTTTKRINEILARLEPKLARRAQPTIEALCGQGGKAGSFEDDQSLLSVLAVLIAQKSRSETVIIHLHDLHWCTFDVLEQIDRLIWQLDHLKVQVASTAAPSGIRVLFLLEGRMHEFREEGEAGWSTKVFERFIDRLACPTARCRSFLPQESAEFAQRLFEQAHTANRILPRALLDLQQELIHTVYQVAGGNPFHMLEQVKLLQQHGILTQNPRTGFMYMVRPEFRHIPLPPTVFETIEARWRYYAENDRKLAVLLWAAALVDDNLPAPLFRHLWSRIAPKVSQTRIESTEFLRFPQSDDEGLQVSFRHENYFQTIRRLQLPESERRAAIDAYGAWFRNRHRLSPALRYVQAKVELEATQPNLKRARKILEQAQDAALRRQDRSLTSRILATLLDDVVWPSDREKPLSTPSLLQACDDETTLCEHLIRSGRPDVAYERIEQTLEALKTRLRLAPASQFLDSLRRRRFSLLAVKAGILFHDRRPAEAVTITDAAVKELDGLVSLMDKRGRKKWQHVIMDVRDAHSAAIALAGDMRRAVDEARKASAIAEGLVETSPSALEVIITSANILLCEAPLESEAVLQHYAQLETLRISEETRLRLNLNLSMARIVVAYQSDRSGTSNGARRFDVAYKILLEVFRKAHPLGRLADAAAAALLLGLVQAIGDKPDDIDWFSQSVSIAVRARQLETLWRAYTNLAHSLYRRNQSPHDAAAAALDLMLSSLSPYAEPDKNPRFDLLSVPMAHVVRYLILAGDEKAAKVLRSFPALRRIFRSLETGELKSDRDGRKSHEWLRVGQADYVIF